MNRNEAINELNRGEILTHIYFDPHEFVKKVSDNNYQYEFEDGCRIDSELFWRDRSGSNWDNDWSIFIPQAK